MTDPGSPGPRPEHERPHDIGSTTQPSGTPMAVDHESDPSTRRAMAMFVAGPVVWISHFMLVYLVAEAGCTGGGPGLSVFDPPVPAVVTIAATVVAATACLWVSRWEYRRWQAGRRLGQAGGDLGQAGPRSGQVAAAQSQLAHDRQGGPLAFVGLLLGLMSFVSVLFVGLPALVLTGC